MNLIDRIRSFSRNYNLICSDVVELASKNKRPMIITVAFAAALLAASIGCLTANTNTKETPRPAQTVQTNAPTVRIAQTNAAPVAVVTRSSNTIRAALSESAKPEQGTLIRVERSGIAEYRMKRYDYICKVLPQLVQGIRKDITASEVNSIAALNNRDPWTINNWGRGRWGKTPEERARNIHLWYEGDMLKYYQEVSAYARMSNGSVKKFVYHRDLETGENRLVRVVNLGIAAEPYSRPSIDQRVDRLYASAVPDKKSALEKYRHCRAIVAPLYTKAA